MSYQKILDKTKKIETLLSEMGAVGKGLHQKLSSIESHIDKGIVRSIRFIASIRNKFLHDANFKLTDELLSDFESSCEKVLRYLIAKNSESQKTNNKNQKSKRISSWKLLVLYLIGAAMLYGWFVKL